MVMPTVPGTVAPLVMSTEHPTPTPPPDPGGPHSPGALDNSARIVEHRRPDAHPRQFVNRTELCARIAARTLLSRANAATGLAAIVSTIADALVRGQAVGIVGFGNFTATHRVPTFKAAKTLRAAVDG